MLVLLFMGKLLKYTWSSMEGNRDEALITLLLQQTVIDLGMIKRWHSVSSGYISTYYTCKDIRVIV